MRIGAGFAAALLMLALLSFAVNARLATAEQHRQWVQHSLEVLKKNEQALRMLKQAESAARGFQLTGAPMFREQFESAVIDMERVLTDLRTLTADNETQQQLVGALVPIARQRIQTMWALFERGRADTEALVMAGSALMDRAQELTTAIDREDSRLLKDRRQLADAGEEFTRRMVGLWRDAGGVADCPGRLDRDTQYRATRRCPVGRRDASRPRGISPTRERRP